MWYLNDALGSAVGLIEKDGRVSSRYHYDEYGIPTEAKKFDINWPGPDNLFGFTGLGYDYYSGMSYARARYYKPEIGRFISEDTYKGSLWSPQSQNGYAYVWNNPIRWADLSGHFKDGDEKYNEDVLLQLSMFTEQWEFAETAYNLGILDYNERNTVQQEAEYFAENARWSADHKILNTLGKIGLFIMDAEFGDPDIAYADASIENPASKIYNSDNYERIKAVNNPYGSKSTPEHQSTVKELEDLAHSKYGDKPEYRIHNQTSIKGQPNGVNRIPDVWVEETKTGKFIEA